MERLFGGKVFLEVWVRVKRGWADDDALLDALRLLNGRSRRMATRAQPLRRDDQPAFVLHTYAVPRDEPDRRGVHRRSTAASRWSRAARKRPRSELRGLLQAFQPLLAVVVGAARAEDAAARPNGAAGCRCVGGSALLCGFYLNELLLKLLPREDPHPRLFATYEAALAELAAGGEQAPVLRRFELRLLPSWATRCRSCATPTPARRSIRRRATITPSTAGPRRAPPEPGARLPVVRGATLLALADGATPTPRPRPRRSG